MVELSQLGRVRVLSIGNLWCITAASRCDYIKCQFLTLSYDTALPSSQNWIRTMNPVSPWLAALAEQCLLFYLGRNSQDGIEVEDLEGCLSFNMRGLAMSAIIDKVRTQ